MAKVDFSGLIGGKKSTISKRDSEKSEKAEKKKKKESTEPKETEPISEPAETEIQQKREKNEISESEPKEPEKVVAEEIESESGFDPAKVEAAISNKTKAGKKGKKRMPTLFFVLTYIKYHQNQSRRGRAQSRQ